MPTPEPEFSDLSAFVIDEEKALVLRAINTERNNLVHWYGMRIGRDGTPDEDSYGMLNGYGDRPFGFFDRNGNEDPIFTGQVAALNRFEARLHGCECCFNNADDFEHYHSEVCDPDYQE